MCSNLHFHNTVCSNLHFHNTVCSNLHFHNTVRSNLHLHNTVCSNLHLHNTVCSSNLHLETEERRWMYAEGRVWLCNLEIFLIFVAKPLEKKVSEWNKYKKISDKIWFYFNFEVSNFNSHFDIIQYAECKQAHHRSKLLLKIASIFKTGSTLQCHNACFISINRLHFIVALDMKFTPCNTQVLSFSI